ncbi:MAG: hypothetical protein LKJ44_06310 [Bifidobacteriaceae bacterium]|jgi:predicted  nucleic acid-binding Zn-ribbon protein|nr:hypothetical protein [Bifidobacteriaceae bacterium]MCI1979305.1 hypothetical protein [Bifidobacteriaceae bacterium]
MKATTQEQQLLFDLQTLDIDARKVRYEAENLEETAHLKHLIEQRKAIVVERKRLAKAQEAVKAENDELEAQIAGLDTKLGSIDVKLKSSGVTPKEVLSLTRQQETLSEQKKDLEEQSMEKLSQIETYEKNDAILQSNDDKLHAAGLDLKNRRDDKISVLKKRMASIQTRRKICIPSIPKDVLQLYADMSKNAQGNVVVRYINGHVEGLHTQLPPAELHQIEAADPEDLVVLEEYGVIVARV